MTIGKLCACAGPGTKLHVRIMGMAGEGVATSVVQAGLTSKQWTMQQQAQVNSKTGTQEA